MSIHHKFPTDAAERHAYSATCNCDECFATYLTLPPPTEAEQEAMARAFSKALCPSGGGWLITDTPVSFPDLDAAARREAA